MSSGLFAGWRIRRPLDDKELLDANADAGSLRHAAQNENRTQVLCNFTSDIAEAAFREGRPPACR